jgi:hypothetical protein
VLIGFALLSLQVSCSATRSYPQGVLVDAVHFTRTVLYHADGMNLISELRIGDFDHDGTSDILAIGSDGIHLLALDGKEKRFTRFQSSEAPWAVISVPDPTGAHAFVGNLPNQAQTVMFDESGRQVWSIAGGNYDQPVVGAFDGEGRQAIVARSKNAGLQLISLEGKPIRTWGSAVIPFFYSAADMTGDGHADLVGEDAAGGKNEIFIASGDGGRMTRWTSPHQFYKFFLARLPGRTSPSVMFHSNDADELVFLDATGAVVKTLSAPWGTKLAIPHGFPMAVSGKDGGFVCLASSKGSNHQHMVYVYGSDDQLVYLDSVADDATSLLVATPEATGSPAPFFLIGGRNTIWKYVQ